MISFDEACKIIEKGFHEIKPETEKVLLERSLHRTLAEDVIADVDLPPFNNSAMDGIAVKYNENINEWKIIGEISAGNYEEFELNDNCAVTIMTGSRLPEFCDTIIPIEDIDLNKDTASLKENSKIKKGDVLTVAKIAGIQAAKKTAELIPLCHNIFITKIDVELQLNEGKKCVEIKSFAKTKSETGIEMEALIAASVAALTVYDMCKAIDRSMVISETKLISKTGGKSGTYKLDDSNNKWEYKEYSFGIQQVVEQSNLN